jgi:hypothetical protein
LINDIQHSQQGHPGGAAKFFAVDPYTATYPFQVGDLSFILINRTGHFSTRLLSLTGAAAERPPACTAFRA